MSIALSSGHSAFLPGAVGIIRERDENVRVVNRVAELLRANNVAVSVFHDSASRSVTANINAIVSWHSRQGRSRNCSIHFNAHRRTDQPMGTECLHRNQASLATRVSAAMARGGRFRDRGAKHRTNLGFLNRLSNAVLLEVCFVDSSADVALYRANFEAICREIASSISGVSIGGGGGSGGGGTSPPSTSRPMIRQGSRGEAVREAQRLLNRHGASPRLNEDGIFGPLTAAATRSFQTRRGLVADAIIGPLTWAALLS